MKKQLLLAASVILFALQLNAQSSVSVVAGNDSSHKWHRSVISTDPLYLAFGVLTLGYERAVSKKIAIFTKLSYEQYYWDEKYDVLINTIQLRWYPAGAAPHGFYTGAFSYYQRAWFINHIHTPGGMCGLAPSEPFDTTVQGNLNSLAFGVMAGYKFIIKKRIAAEFYAGGGINSWWGKNEQYASISFDNNFQPHFGIDVGYAFK